MSFYFWHNFIFNSRFTSPELRWPNLQNETILYSKSNLLITTKHVKWVYFTNSLQIMKEKIRTVRIILLNLLSTPLCEVPRSDAFKRFPSFTSSKTDGFTPVGSESCETFAACWFDDMLLRTTRAARATKCRPLATLESIERLNDEGGRAGDDDDDDAPTIWPNDQVSYLIRKWYINNIIKRSNQ